MNTRIIILLLAGSILFLGCSDYNQFDPYESEEKDQSFLSELIPKRSNEIIDPNFPHTILTDDSILVEIPANAFMDAFGKTIDEFVQIDFYHYQYPVQWMAADISLIDEHFNSISPLSVMHIRANTSDGRFLSMKNGHQLKIKYPYGITSSLPGIFLPASPSHEANRTLWYQTSSNPLSNYIAKDDWTWKAENGTIKQYAGYSISLSQLNWVVVGHKIAFPGATVQVILPNHFDQENTQIFLIGKNPLSIQKLNWDSQKKSFFTHQNTVSLDKELHLLSVSFLEKDQIFLDINSVRVNADETFELQPTLVSREEAISLLETL